MSDVRILIVDDNPEICEIVEILLAAEGFQVDAAADGYTALDKIKECSYDLIILDIMMPGLSGYQTCMKIREESNVPILFLSAKSQVEDKTLGFSSGGDDYLPKPFSYNELVGRVKALVRRYQVYQGKEQDQGRPEPDEIEMGSLNIDLMEKTVRFHGNELELTDTEFAILKLLAGNRKQIFSAQQLYESVWQEPYYYGASNTVMVHIRNLRNKIEEDPHNPKLIRNIWGKGYCCE